ncbi:hypothetical protein KR49_07000 [Synechococcus sp. KORDI-49]|uniref:S8 family peptidase n=1 Tax=Synechococcus sp. KORDI-49 TaxID=585423 RepID=UPI0004E05CFF|nr:S8 family peptidase [Synechococcus sp. KORDI-49]AII46197.1 hypothetical protein KR49_07000 [Synechococcus sp. KORDI-49]
MSANPITDPNDYRSGNEWTGTNQDDLLLWVNGSDQIDGMAGDDILQIPLNFADVDIHTSSTGITKLDYKENSYTTQNITVYNVETIAFLDQDLDLSSADQGLAPITDPNDYRSGNEWTGTNQDDLLLWVNGSDQIDGMAGDDILQIPLNFADVDIHTSSTGITKLDYKENSYTTQNITVYNVETIAFLDQDLDLSSADQGLAPITDPNDYRSGNAWTGTNQDDLLLWVNGSDQIDGMAGDDILQIPLNFADVDIHTSSTGITKLDYKENSYTTQNITVYNVETIAFLDQDLDLSSADQGLAPITDPSKSEINRTQWNGTTEDDVLIWLGGDDIIDGKGGNDTLQVALKRSNVVIHTDFARISRIEYDQNSAFGSKWITLYNIENIAFLDKTEALETTYDLLEFDLEPILDPDDSEYISTTWENSTSNNDFLIWLGGEDIIDGGDGVDSLSLNLKDSEVVVSNKTAGHATIEFNKDSIFGAKSIKTRNVEYIDLLDKSYEIIQPEVAINTIDDPGNSDYLRSQWAGTEDDDVLVWLGGDDIIDGKGGNDTIQVALKSSEALIHTDFYGISRIEYDQDSVFGSKWITIYNVENIAFLDTVNALETTYDKLGFDLVPTLDPDDSEYISTTWENSTDKHDILIWLGGEDIIDGGDGVDTLSLNLKDSEVLLSNTTPGHATIEFDRDSVLGPKNIQTRNIEFIDLLDQTYEIVQPEANTNTIDDPSNSDYLRSQWAGTQDDDVLVWLGGDDIIDGKGGNDTLQVSIQSNEATVHTDVLGISRIEYDKNSVLGSKWITFFNIENIAFLDKIHKLEAIDEKDEFKLSPTIDPGDSMYSMDIWDNGTEHDDHFLWLAGADIIDGSAGNDTVSINLNVDDVEVFSSQANETILRFQNTTHYTSNHLYLQNIEAVALLDGSINLNESERIAKNLGSIAIEIEGFKGIDSILTVKVVAPDPNGYQEYNVNWHKSDDGLNWTSVSNNYSYALTSRDAGSHIRAEAIYVDNDGFAEKVTAEDLFIPSNLKEKEYWKAQGKYHYTGDEDSDYFTFSGFIQGNTANHEAGSDIYHYTSELDLFDSLDGSGFYIYDTLEKVGEEQKEYAKENAGLIVNQYYDSYSKKLYLTRSPEIYQYHANDISDYVENLAFIHNGVTYQFSESSPLDISPDDTYSYEDLGMLSSNHDSEHHGAVKSQSYADWWFSVDDPLRAEIQLTDFQDDLDIYLYKLKDEKLDLIGQSEAAASSPELLEKALEAGDYILEVSFYEDLDDSSEPSQYSLTFTTESLLAEGSLLPNDPRFDDQWYLLNTGQADGIAHYDVSAAQAWKSIQDASEIVVAVVDTGVNINHEDLVSNIWVNAGEIPGNGLDDDQNGYIDDIHGWHFDVTYASNHVMDYRGHGTHVAGTIGAEGNNSIGVTGVAWDVQLMPVKVFPDMDGAKSANQDVLDGIKYAVDNGADVINLSLGAYHLYSSLEELKKDNPHYYNLWLNALTYASDNDVVVIAAAGNEEYDLDTTHISVPASFSSIIPGMISVAAIANNGDLAYYSNYGETVTIGAPGGDMKTNNNIQGGILNTYKNGYYYLQGTSMAAPVVAGAAALIRAQYPELTAAEVKQAIVDGAQQFKQLQSVVDAGSYLDIPGALTEAALLQDNSSRARHKPTLPGFLSTGQTIKSISQDPGEASSDSNATQAVEYLWEISYDGVEWATVSQSAEFEIEDAHEGALLKLTEGYTDESNSVYFLESDPSQIEYSNDGAAEFQIQGNSLVGSELLIEKIKADPDGDGSFTYQWQLSSDGSNWSSIGSSQSLRLDEAYADANIKVIVSYTDQQGFNESIETTSLTIQIPEVKPPAENKTDTSPPTLQSLQLSSDNLDLSLETSLQASIQLSDDISGFADDSALHAEIRWLSPSGNQFVDASFYASSSGNDLDATFTDTVSFLPSSETGTWSVDYLRIIDDAGNSTQFNNSELLSLSIDPSFSLSAGTDGNNNNTDTAPPTLQSLQLSSDNLDLSLETSLQASIQLSDDISGFADDSALHAEIRWLSPSGNQFVDASFYASSSGNDLDATFTDTVSFLPSSETGTWSVDYLRIIDDAGNRTQFNSSELLSLSIDPTFSLSAGTDGNNNNTDTAPPTLQSLQLSSDNLDLSLETSLQASIQLSDDISGFADDSALHAEIRWLSPSGNQFVDASFYASSSGNDLDATFTDTVSFLPSSETGTWSVDYLRIIDDAGNRTQFNSSELLSLSIDPTFDLFRNRNENSISSDPTDIDGDNLIQPLTDGLILTTAAYAIEVASGALTAPASFNGSLLDAVIHPASNRSTSAAIKAHLTSAISSSSLESNNNGIVDLQDAESMLRSAMGTFPGNALSSDLAESALTLGTASPLTLEQQLHAIEQTAWLG